MAWRRKPDGRPYADVMVNGVRYRESLLTAEQQKAGPPWPDDAACAKVYSIWRRSRLPRLIQHQKAAVRPRTEKTLAELCTWYVDTVMVARNNAQTTRDRNRKRLAQVCDQLARQNVETASDLEANPSAIDAWVADALRCWGPSTVRLHMVVFRAVLRAAVARRVIAADPIQEWPDLRIPDIVRQEPLTPDQVSRLLHALERGGWGGHRSLATYAVQFVAFTGCRPIDACQLTKDRLIDLDGAAPRAFIRQQKTGKLVSIALAPPAVAAVRAALERGSERCEHVFQSRRGTPCPKETLLSALHRASRRALGYSIGARRLREALVSCLVDAGVSLEMVAKITGHRSRAIYAYLRVRQDAAHAAATLYADQIVTPLSPRGREVS